VSLRFFGAPLQPDEEVDGFRDFYKKHFTKEQQDKIISDTLNINITYSKMNQLHCFQKNNSMLRKQREVKTFINVDSRDRNKFLSQTK
jgi:hypothetical protein